MSPFQFKRLFPLCWYMPVSPYISLNLGTLVLLIPKLYFFLHKCFVSILYLIMSLLHIKFLFYFLVEIVHVSFVAVSWHKLFHKQVIHMSNLYYQERKIIKMKSATNNKQCWISLNHMRIISLIFTEISWAYYISSFKVFQNP